MEVYVVSAKDVGLLAIFSTSAGAKSFVAEETVDIPGLEIETYHVHCEEEE